MIRQIAIIAAALTLTGCATPYGPLENRIVCTLDGSSLMMVSRYAALGITSNATSEDARIVCNAILGLQKPAQALTVPVSAPVVSSQKTEPLPQPQPKPQPPAAAASEPFPDFPPKPIITPGGVIFPPLIIQPKKAPQ